MTCVKLSKEHMILTQNTKRSSFSSTSPISKQQYTTAASIRAWHILENMLISTFVPSAVNPAFSMTKKHLDISTRTYLSSPTSRPYLWILLIVSYACIMATRSIPQISSWTIAIHSITTAFSTEMWRLFMKTVRGIFYPTNIFLTDGMLHWGSFRMDSNFSKNVESKSH